MMNFEPTDRIDEMATELSREVTDELCRQNNMDDIAEESDDTWYEAQAMFREVILQAISDAIPNHFIIC